MHADAALLKEVPFFQLMDEQERTALAGVLDVVRVPASRPVFAYGDPGPGLWMLVLSMIVYGMAFDFFNISGSMYVNLEANARIRASAQGLFMIMTNGLGAFLGTMVAGAVVDLHTAGGVRDWQSIWLTFAGYALVLGILFPFVFRYKHDRARMAATALAH